MIKNRIGGARLKIAGETETRAWEFHDRLQTDAQMKFLNRIMKDEDVDFETAAAIATGRTDPPEWEYTLAYKLCDPVLQIALNAQRRPNREKARANFEETLTPEELKLFREYWDKKTTEVFRSELKKQKGRAKRKS